MKALFIGQSYIDITFLTDEMPTGDEKTVARDYAVSFGGNAVTAAFCCAKLGIAPDLMSSVADDWLGRMFVDMAAKYGISVHHRKVAQSSLSFIMPKGGQRAIVRCRDDNFRHPFPVLNLPAAARSMSTDTWPTRRIHYAKICHEAGILTSLDGGGLRSNTHDLLGFISAAVVAERLCEQMKLSPGEMLTYLRSRGCKIGAVTMGSRGMLWYDETKTERFMPALVFPMTRSSTPMARATSSTAPTCIRISSIRPSAGSSTSNSRARRRPTRSSILATRRACRHSPKPTRRRRGSASGGRAPSSLKWSRMPGATPRSRGQRRFTAKDQDGVSGNRQAGARGKRVTVSAVQLAVFRASTQWVHSGTVGSANAIGSGAALSTMKSGRLATARAEHVRQEAAVRKIPVLLGHLVCVRRQPQHVVGAVRPVGLDPGRWLKLRKAVAQSRELPISAVISSPSWPSPDQSTQPISLSWQ